MLAVHKIKMRCFDLDGNSIAYNFDLRLKDIDKQRKQWVEQYGIAVGKITVELIYRGYYQQ